jgi:hypothetical protein
MPNTIVNYIELYISNNIICVIKGKRGDGSGSGNEFAAVHGLFLLCYRCVAQNPPESAMRGSHPEASYVSLLADMGIYLARAGDKAPAPSNRPAPDLRRAEPTVLASDPSQ